MIGNIVFSIISGIVFVFILFFCIVYFRHDRTYRVVTSILSSILIVISISYLVLCIYENSPSAHVLYHGTIKQEYAHGEARLGDGTSVQPYYGETENVYVVYTKITHTIIYVGRLKPDKGIINY